MKRFEIKQFSVSLSNPGDPWFVGWLECACVFFVLQSTGCWGFQKFPVICGLATTRLDAMKLLQGRPAGTFLLRLSSEPGALAVMYIKPMQEASQRTGPQQRGRFAWSLFLIFLLCCRHQKRPKYTYAFQRRRSLVRTGNAIFSQHLIGKIQVLFEVLQKDLTKFDSCVRMLLATHGSPTFNIIPRAFFCVCRPSAARERSHQGVRWS